MTKAFIIFLIAAFASQLAFSQLRFNQPLLGIDNFDGVPITYDFYDGKLTKVIDGDHDNDNFDVDLDNGDLELNNYNNNDNGIEVQEGDEADIYDTDYLNDEDNEEDGHIMEYCDECGADDFDNEAEDDAVYEYIDVEVDDEENLYEDEEDDGGDDYQEFEEDDCCDDLDYTVDVEESEGALNLETFRNYYKDEYEEDEEDYLDDSDDEIDIEDSDEEYY